MLVETLPPAFGGAARQALALADQLRRQGASIFFVTARRVPDSPRVDTLQGFAVYRVPHAESGKWIKLNKVLSYCALFWRHRRRFDVLHVHGPYYLSLAAAVFARHVLRKKVVLKLTSINFDTPSAVRAGWYPGLSWFFYRNADAFVCTSTAQWNDCRAHGLPEERLHKIPNGTDPATFRPPESLQEQRALKQQLGLDPGRLYGLFIGSIEENKGIRLLVDAAAKVCAARPDVSFLLVGPDGRTPGESYISMEFVNGIRQRIREAGLEERILLLGRKDNPADYLRASSFFVFPSRSEGFGTVLIEAMASGLPAICLNIPGVTTDIITHNKDGIIIEREDPAAFAASMLNVVSDAACAETLAISARRTVLARFSFDTIGQAYARLYSDLTA